VKQMVDSSGMQYAVIAGLRTETGPERLVIAYPNEESLRELIAAASIIAVGFCSREEAWRVAELPWRLPFIASKRETESQVCRDWEGFSSHPTATLLLRSSPSCFPGMSSLRQSGWLWAVPAEFFQCLALLDKHLGCGPVRGGVVETGYLNKILAIIPLSS